MMVLVTHHVEEVPDGFTHAMLLRRGSVLAAGPIDEVFTARNLSRCFGVQLEIEHRQSRWTARAAESGPANYAQIQRSGPTRLLSVT